MRPRPGTLAAALAAFLTACGPASFQSITIDIPAVSSVAVEEYGAIAVEDFLESRPAADVPVGRRTAEYLETELRREFKGKVSRVGSAGRPAAGLVLSGTIGIAALAQKALRERDIVKDGPFGLADRGLAERKRFTMTVEYRLSDAATGRVLLGGAFKESRTYADAQQTLDFALFDLLPAIKARLFPAIFGRISSGERYLLLR